MVPEAPDDLVVVGDGALMAALTRSRGDRMRDIVATIQRHQDEAIRRQRPRHHRDHRRPRHRQDRGRPAPGGVPALLRPAPVRVGRHPRRRPLRRLHGVHRAGAALARRGDASRCARSATSSTASPPSASTRPPSARHQGLAADPPAAGAAPPAAASRTPRPSSGPCRRPRGAARGPRARPGALARSCASTSATRRRRRRPGALAEAAWASRHHRRARRQGRVPRQVRGPPRRRGVHAARGGRRSTRARCCSGSPTPTACAATRAGRCPDDEVEPARRVVAATPSRPAPGRWPTSRSSTTSPPALGPRPGGAARGARLLRDRGARRPQPATASPRCSRSVNAPQRDRARHAVAPHRPARAAARRAASASPTEYAHVLVDEAQDLSPMQWRMLGRRGR